MKPGKISGLVAGIVLMCGTLAAQTSTSNMTLICPTTDGNITVDEKFVCIKDYKLSLSGEQAPGVLLLRDNNANATAVLDTRSGDGIYLAVTEGGITMQLVAARKNITFDEASPMMRPASPAVSSVEAGATTDIISRLSILQEPFASGTYDK